MNAKTAKLARRVSEKRNPFILLKLIQIYGEKTKEMNPRQVYRAIKKLIKDEKVNLKSLVKEMDNANSQS
jgi:hypothetical protein